MFLINDIQKGINSRCNRYFELSVVAVDAWYRSLRCADGCNWKPLGASIIGLYDCTNSIAGRLHKTSIIIIKINTNDDTRTYKGRLSLIAYFIS